MLILSRLIGQSVMIGDHVKVTVLGFHGGGQIRLGFEAPKEVKIHRLELYNRIAAEKAS
jgi:carbon storage regulator